MSIPTELVKDMEFDPYYRRCVFTGSTLNLQWHHVFLYQGKSIQEKWAIVPVTKETHDKCTQHKTEYDKEVADKVELISLNRATDEDLEKYSKVDSLILKRDLLRDKFRGKK